MLALLEKVTPLPVRPPLVEAGTQMSERIPSLRISEIQWAVESWLRPTAETVIVPIGPVAGVPAGTGVADTTLPTDMLKEVRETSEGIVAVIVSMNTGTS